ncbi:hypothetical protein DFJ58DRAFT_723369 [Suillus subalutaceus]|uniref:uncharacterized protein n=1 Tax=Suillus subalutaceus TaxID=48586 RepID=UPI001B8849F3|nr:uncharacterized protein DFJ58DRAFT_723369 [Suillus subalutaceus]KAG1868956.1 hypothetical protein DFJ58DRAFT_723369 [Suillus subalutaceus]
MHEIFQIVIDLDKNVDDDIHEQDVEREAVMKSLGATKVMDECTKWEDTDADGEYIDTLMMKVSGILDEIIATSEVILESINPAVLHSNDTEKEVDDALAHSEFW